MESGGGTHRQTRLNAFEDSTLQTGVNPSSTITWCSGALDVATAASWVIEKRLRAVLAANPWLAGKIVKDDGNYYLRYDDTPSTKDEIHRMFRYIPSSVLFTRRTPYVELGGALATEGLLLGRHYDEAKPLLLISVVGVEGEDEFAVVASLSHVTCDGCTFYQIYNMLLHGNDIVALDPTRIDLQRESQEEKMGKEETNLLSSAGFILAALRGIFSTKVLGYFTRRYDVQTKVHIISNDRIEELKREKDKDIPFLSTNDILTSWFLTNCACRHGMMAVNLRGRLEGYDRSLAGNYENLIYYRSPEDCAAPSMIRKSIELLKRTVTTATPINGWTRLARDDFSIITNWATFASDDAKGIFGLKGCKAIGHLPVYDLKNCVPSIAVAVIVRYAPETTAIICSGTEAQLKGLEDTCNFADATKKVDSHFWE